MWTRRCLRPAAHNNVGAEDDRLSLGARQRPRATEEHSDAEEDASVDAATPTRMPRDVAPGRAFGKPATRTSFEIEHWHALNAGAQADDGGVKAAAPARIAYVAKVLFVLVACIGAFFSGSSVLRSIQLHSAEGHTTMLAAASAPAPKASLDGANSSVNTMPHACRSRLAARSLMNTARCADHRAVAIPDH